MSGIADLESPNAPSGTAASVGARVPFVSVLVPCRNEERYIGGCLASIVGGAYPADRLEILVIDGESDDRTRVVVSEFASRDPRLRLLRNPGRTAPAALNVGLAEARGDVIVRMDAHNAYPAHYIPRLVEWLERSGADNVGGTWETRPASNRPVAKAIAAALAHPFGVGNAHFRIGTSHPRWVDTVPFGCYRREVFDRIGGFDEDLVRNQDDEFNLRLRRRGGRILLVPDVVSVYYARDSISKLARMYYQYGYFKPLATRKVGRVLTIRQLVPAALVSWVTLLGIAALFSPIAAVVWAIGVVAYAVGVIASAASVARRTGVRTGLAACVVFPVLHMGYGVGFLRGVVDFIALRRDRARRADAIRLSR